jgi:hypothetical protein
MMAMLRHPNVWKRLRNRGINMMKWLHLHHLKKCDYPGSSSDNFSYGISGAQNIPRQSAHVISFQTNNKGGWS